MVMFCTRFWSAWQVCIGRKEALRRIALAHFTYMNDDGAETIKTTECSKGFHYNG